MKPIEEFIRNDPHVRGVYPSLHVAPRINNDAFGEYATNAQRAVKILTLYVQGPIIIDNFIEHGKRRAWRQRREQEHTDFHAYYQYNRLKYNRMNPVQNALPMLLRWYNGNNKNEVEKLMRETLQRIPQAEKEYDALPLDAKIGLAEDISGRVVRIMELMNT